MAKGKKKKENKTTPLMEQYLRIKADYKDVLLLYRMGDFYETFYEDAKLLAKTLGIALTKRAHGKAADVPLAGFPYHALDNHLPKLLNAGLRVAICEQVEDPKTAKGVVKREVVEIASRGYSFRKVIGQSFQQFFGFRSSGRRTLWHGHCRRFHRQFSSGRISEEKFT